MESTPPVGATGIIAPRCNDRRRGSNRPPSTPPRASEPPLALKNLRVLVVDDDPASAKLMSVTLRAEGCDTRIAGSAEEALPLVSTFRPRLIMLDLVLPFMSGLSFAQQLKGDPATRNIVIVAVSAYNGYGVERAATEVGCALFLRKPVDPVVFPQLLTTYLGGVE